KVAQRNASPRQPPRRRWARRAPSAAMRRARGRSGRIGAQQAPSEREGKDRTAGVPEVPFGKKLEPLRTTLPVSGVAYSLLARVLRCARYILHTMQLRSVGRRR